MPLIRLAAAALALAAPLAFAQVEKPELKFSLDWLFQGSQSPMVLAAEQGLFKAEGLDVTVDKGAGSVNTINRVASGTYDVGFADLNALIKFNAENPGREVTGFYMVFDQSPLAIATLADRNIAQPRDLQGRRIGGNAFEGARQMFPVFAKQARIDPGAVQWVSIDPALRETLLVRGDVDAISIFITSGPLSLEALGVPPERIRVFKYADHGLDFYGSVLFARAEFIEKHPRTVAAFARAMNRAIQESLARPERAIAAVKARDALINDALELRRWKLTAEHLIVTPGTRRHGLSHVDAGRLQRNIAMVAEAFGIAQPPKPSVVFTDRFLPGAAERALPR